METLLGTKTTREIFQQAVANGRALYAAALRSLQPPEMRRKAADLGAALRAEPDGVTEALRLIEAAIARKESQT